MMGSLIRRYLPVVGWLGSYRRAELPGDVIAGLVVAIMLVPQGMAYAMLAGLPAQVGLYASIAPLVLYSLFGSSRSLAVGPVAIVSLMVASTLASLAEPGSSEYVALAIVLAVLSGLALTIVGLARLGFLVNFMSHPVISGFTSAAALVIGFSQLKHLLGLDIPRSHHITDTLMAAVERAGQINWTTVTIAGLAVAILLYAKGPMAGQLKRLGVSESWADPISKSGPLISVVLGILVVRLFRLDSGAGVGIVGEVPRGLPPLTVPRFDRALWQELLPAALLISFVGFLESVSVAKSLASKRRQKVDADQELVALGMANVGAAFTGGYPVTGGFSRSVVNFSAGANTPLASIITAALIAITVVLLTPLLYFLPQAVLAAVIVVAVVGLVDLRTVRETWRFNKPDAVSLLATFVTVLAVGVEVGIIVGVILSLVLYLWRTSRPHMAVVGRVGDSEHFRNVKRHTVTTYPNLLAVRVDESLYFANTAYLEDQLLAMVADNPEIEHLVLICSAVNFLDASALETLEMLIDRLRDSGVRLHLAEIKGPVMDRLQRSELLDRLAPGQVFLSTHAAVETLAEPQPA